MHPAGRFHLLVHSILCLPIIQNNNLIKDLASYDTLALFLPVIMFPKFDKIDFCHTLLYKSHDWAWLFLYLKNLFWT